VEVDALANQYCERSLYGEGEACIPVFDNPQIQITAFKPAYDGNGYILRAFERAGKAATASLQLPAGYRLVGEVNLLEDAMAEAVCEMSFKPFQIRSFRLVRESGR